MKKTLRRSLCLLLAMILMAATTLFTGCSKKKRIIIYTSAEDFRIAYMEARMKEEFPQYDIVFEYMSSSKHASLLKAEGKHSPAHISHDIEYGYAASLTDLGIFADLSAIDGLIDFSVYTEDAVPETYYTPVYRNGGAIIINNDVIREKGLDIPTSYEDLLDPQYKGLISMPSPKASGTGYMFLLSLVNAWGEEKAFDYFDQLSENVLSFTASGSGPVNALVTKEVAIGLGMTFQAAQQISDGENLSVLFFDEGSPYTFYGQGILAGKETDPAVVEVFKFLSTTLTEEVCERFCPEKIFHNKTFALPNYPTDIPYADMSNNTPERKAELLSQWKY